jgi:hypothetical protein
MTFATFDSGALGWLSLRAYRFFPPTPGTAATCCIHAPIWRSSMSSTDASSTPRVDFVLAVPLRPGTPLLPRGELLQEGLPVVGPLLPVNPADTERDIQRFGVGQ